jgi:hypothetical protein
VPHLNRRLGEFFDRLVDLSSAPSESFQYLRDRPWSKVVFRLFFLKDVFDALPEGRDRT